MGRQSPTGRVSGENFKGPDSKDRWPHGKTSTFTEELGERIIEFMWSGECKSVMDIEKQDWAPTRQTLYTWKKTFPAFGEAMYEAQIALADVYMDENQKIKEDMLAGEIEPSAANVAIKMNQHLAMTVDPRTYGSKSYTENKTLHITTQHINRIDIDGLDDEQLDALENALSAKLLTGPSDGAVLTARED